MRTKCAVILLALDPQTLGGTEVCNHLGGDAPRCESLTKAAGSAPCAVRTQARTPHPGTGFRASQTSETRPQTLGQAPRSQRAACLHSPSWRGFPRSERLLSPTSPALTALSPQSNNYLSGLQSRPLWQQHTTAFKGGTAWYATWSPDKEKERPSRKRPV